jgi:hypothetical protein
MRISRDIQQQQWLLTDELLSQNKLTGYAREKPTDST